MTTLRQAERSRRTLLANLSHDFRTPLASLRAIVDTLQDGALDEPAAAVEFLGRMDAEVESLSHLVAEFLELSQLEAGQITLQPEPIDIRQHLVGVVGRMTPQAQQHAVDLRLDVPVDLPPLWLDPRRLEQVLLNLLQNALAFTPAGGRITVRASQADAALHLAVQDTGAGIAAADVPHIFERFYRADQARSRPGAGLGLAIVRHLIELQGGQVAAASGLGRGTTITISLPITAPPNLAPISS
jgi:two-component system phosphate regulon sensor histidine kinase PhoR